MARKRIRVSSPMLFTWFVLAGLILFLAPQSLTGGIRAIFMRTFSVPLMLGRVASLSAEARQVPANSFESKEIQYHNYIANLEQELRQKQEVIEKLSGLRNRFRGLEGAKLVVADVITANLTGAGSELMINRGYDDGIAKDQFVLGDNCVIGTISEVWNRSAKVRLITDPKSRVQVRIGELKTARLMKGCGRNTAKISLVPVEQKVKAGDTVWAEKKAGLLDSPIKVGTVERCKRSSENALLWDITVKPACDIERLTSTAVVIMNPKN